MISNTIYIICVIVPIIINIMSSKECQVQHWKQHKSACTIIKERYDIWKEARNEALPDGTALDTKEGPCAICLEETITNPVVLPCGHAFCFACVGGYKLTPNSKDAACPYCRGEIPDVMGKAMERSSLYMDRAYTASNCSEEQKKYAKLALAELDSIVDLLSTENKELQMNTMHAKARMMAMTDQPDKTIKIVGEVLSLNDRYPGVLDLDKVEYAKCSQAEAYVALGKWKEAGRIYKALYNIYLQRGDYNVSVEMGLARTKYELGKYDEAIELGKMAINLMRSCPGVHKYVALSQKALGDIDAAAKTVSKAILYEEHWDKDNMQENKQLLRELSSLLISGG